MHPPRDRDLLVALNAADTVTRAALCRLGLCLDAWRDAPCGADPQALAAELGVPRRQLRRALELRGEATAAADREAERAAVAGAELVTLLDPDYPPALRELALPPPVLVCRGRLPADPAVAVVGSRRADGYGREVAAYFAGGLARAGVTVVSGFARGVDAIAHRVALEAGGSTVAVLGCGVDVDYPRGHRELGEAIAAAGAVVSELSCGAPPRTWHFPIRNRLIAALSQATLVVQAAPRSGSLSTAHHALELGRDVWAVPGRIFDELALGTNALVGDGALVARSLPDLLEGLGFGRPAATPVAPPAESVTESAPPPSAPPPPPGLARTVLAALPAGAAQTADDLAAAVEQPVDRVLGALLELELGGWLRREPGPVYVRP